jgi:hypothetical protein
MNTNYIGFCVLLVTTFVMGMSADRLIREKPNDPMQDIVKFNDFCEVWDGLKTHVAEPPK